MKLVTLTMLFMTVLWVGHTEAQSQKIPFVEHFSNTRCPNCNNNRTQIDGDLNTFNGEVNTMTIHRRYPSPTCPLYEFAKEEADNREGVYSNSTKGLSFTPTLSVNGNPKHYNMFVDEIELVLDENEVLVGLNMEESGTSTKKATLEVFNLTGSKMENLYVYAALVENEIQIDINNKNTTIHDVFRTFLGDQKGKGDAVGSLAAGDSKTIVLEGQVPNGLNSSNLYVLAWVEERKPEGESYELIMHNSVSRTTSTITSSNLEISQGDLALFPNPVMDHLSIRNTSDFSPTHYRIVSATGQEVKRLVATDSSIDVSDLPSGQYLLTMENDEARVTRKFVKQ